MYDILTVENIAKEAIKENLKLREEINTLKKHVDSLKQQLQNLRSDLIVEKALKRNRP